MTRLAAVPSQTFPASVALLLFRLVVGGAFIVYGSAKIAHPATWLDTVGVHGVPAVLQFAAFATELIGGICIVVGLVTPAVAALIVIDMVVAIFIAVLPNGGGIWIDPRRPLTLEKNVFYIASMIVFIGVGPGRLSLDALLSGTLAKRSHAALTGVRGGPSTP